MWGPRLSLVPSSGGSDMRHGGCSIRNSQYKTPRPLVFILEMPYWTNPQLSMNTADQGTATVACQRTIFFSSWNSLLWELMINDYIHYIFDIHDTSSASFPDLISCLCIMFIIFQFSLYHSYSLIVLIRLPLIVPSPCFPWQIALLEFCTS